MISHNERNGMPVAITFRRNIMMKTKWILVLALSAVISLSGACSLIGGKDKADNSLLMSALLLNNNCSVIQGTISANTTLPMTSCLSGTVFVASGVILTIPAGATVYGLSGSSLFILSGAKINAVGTSISPIVFTSAQPAGSRRAQDWGGVVIIGNASTNDAARSTEGTTPQNYGGASSNNDAHDPGSLKYVRIEYAGFPVTTNSELNCLSLYAVGNSNIPNSATPNLDYIQCHLSADDSFEFFGGAVNAKHLVSSCPDDDGFDMDVGYHGKLQHLIQYGDCNFTSTESNSRGMEMNGVGESSEGYGQTPGTNGGAYTSFSTPKVANVTVIGHGSNTRGAGIDEGARFRNGMAGNFTHISFDKLGTAGAQAGVCSTSGANASTSVLNNHIRNTSTAPVALSNTSSCTVGAEVTTVVQVITTYPVIATGTAGNFTTSLPAAVQNVTAATGFVGDAFFDSSTTYGGVTGADWTSGWTTWVPN